ncbi:MAG: cytochrome C oxidase subunit IV family protein [Gammaproteobacteria bacterium]|nr:cytochrome C oxidase subunit IV family protein [Gammaproteobacteria bacterium]
MMIGNAERVWLVLIGLTLVGIFFAETGHAGWLLTLTVATLIIVKGSLIIDYYMDMRSANKQIRNVLRLFITIIPILVILVHAWGDEIQKVLTVF